MRILCCLIGLLALMSAPSIGAEDYDGIFMDGAAGRIIEPLIFINVGGAIIANQAADNPESFGKTIMALSPLMAAFGDDGSWRAYTTRLSFGLAYGAWNKSMEDESESTVFRKNMYLFNSVAITAIILSELHRESKSQLTFSPMPSGGYIMYQGNF